MADARALLRLGYGLVPIVAGADKFTNRLTDWEKYLSPAVERRIPMSGRSFMRLVGIVEIAAGLLVLAKPRKGAALVAAWLGAITANLVSMGEYLDVAARDALLAMGAAALASLPEKQAKMARPAMTERRMRIDPVGTVPRQVH